MDCNGHCGISAKTYVSIKYMIVIWDCGTKYQEAVPLCSIDAATVAEELVKLFFRVGIPVDILID